MAISPEQQYPDKITPASLDYPQGQARNVTTPGDGTGTPLEQAWVNDVFGFQQALLAQASITPSGQPDTARNSQYLDALDSRYADTQDLAEIMNRLYDLENRVYEDTAINQVIYVEQHFNSSAEVAAYKGYGTWERALKGRVAVGFSDIVADNSNFKTFGAKYGEATVALTGAQNGPHSHAINVRTGNISGSIRPAFDSNSSSAANLSTESSGSGQPHNNIQPSQTLDCWKRIA